MGTNPRFQHLYSLGLAGQDQVNRAFGGGLPTGSIVLVEGRHGTGKSTLAGRFAYGLCEQSHSVTYLSTERGFRQFLNTMQSLSYNMQKSALRRDLLYLFGELGRDRADEQPELLSRLQASSQLWNSDVIVFDTFSDILLYDPTVESVVANSGERRIIHRLIRFFRQIIATGTTIVLFVSPSGLADQTLDPFRAIADVLLDISVTNTANNQRRVINVQRFAGMGHQVDNRIGFSIRPATGIVIEYRSVVSR